MTQIIRRVATLRSAGVCLIMTTLLYLASCQNNPGVAPAERTQSDSTSVGLLGGEDPPKKPNGPGCCN